MQARKDSVQFILQDDNPVYYASRTLTSAEKNYQNLERECIVAVWGMEKFHYFLYGKHFTLQTDQKPLVSIFQKHMIDVSPRIQRIPIRAWQYQFKPQYISGKMNVIADALLRVTPLDFEDHNVDKEVLAVNVLTYTAIEEKEKTELLNETDKDAELQALKMVISKGWPKKRSNLAPNLQPYWNYRDELTIEDGILMKGQKIIIPTSLKQQYIDKIHTGHTGIGSCLKKAREFVFWVNYSKDIQEADYRCTPISSSIPSPAEILFGRKFCSELMLPSQVINPRISSQREMIAKKEGKFHPISMNSNNMVPYEAGQCVWIQDPASKKWNPGSIKEKATEPNSYWVEPNSTEYRRNTNFIKPRQMQDIDPLSRASTEVHFSISEASASGPATIQTSSVDAIPTEHTAITTTSDRKTSTTTPVKQYDAPARVSSRSNKGIAPRCYGFEE